MSRYLFISLGVLTVIALAEAIRIEYVWSQFRRTRSTQHATRNPQNEREAKERTVNGNISNSTPPDEKGKDAQSNFGPGLDERQTDAEESMAFATWVGSFAAVISFWLLLYTLNLSIRQTESLAETNEIMRKAHEAENRPWVSLDVNIEAGFKGVIIDGKEEGFMLRAVCTCRNHGASPATHVGCELQMKAVPIANVENEPAELMRELAKKMKTEGRATGGILFPTTEPEHATREPYITRKSINDAAGTTGKYAIALYGVIQYRFPGKTEIYQTMYHSLLGVILQQQPVKMFADIPAIMDLAAHQIGVRFSRWSEPD